MKNQPVPENIRNIAIIAHVDHGKTTLVDSMFNQCGVFRLGVAAESRLMDNLDLERERGITIAAKNCSVRFRGVKINVLDTPGHADFGGEVERALSMADGAILLVDSCEGPLPQTRFVLKKAMEMGLKIIAVVNKIDRKDARPMQVLDEIYDLFIDLDADDGQVNFPYLFAIGRDGVAMESLDAASGSLAPLFEMIIREIPPPKCDKGDTFRMLVSDLGYSDYLGRLAIGRIHGGSVKSNDLLMCIGETSTQTFKTSKVQIYDGVSLIESATAGSGEIAVISGADEIRIGDTICSRVAVLSPVAASGGTVAFAVSALALPRIRVDEPTMSMEFTINTSPFAGREGRFVQSGKIRERLVKETLKNVAIRFEETGERDRFIVKGRGEFQMAIMIETMRREGFEMAVGRPEVIYRDIDGKKHEPVERLYVDCEEDYLGAVTERLCARRGKLESVSTSFGRVRAEFSVPTRAIIGYRDEFLTQTRGTGVLNSLFEGYEPYRGDFPIRFTGSIVADRPGLAVAYALFHLEPRGRLLVAPGELVYEGMIVGEHSKESDINVNAVKAKKLTNMRASGKDENTVCAPVKPMTLEWAINFIREDEMVEVTPRSIRMHKKILSAQTRSSAAKPPKEKKKLAL